MRKLLRQLEVALVVLSFVACSAFLLKMCYLSLAFNTIFGVLFLSALYLYLRLRHGVRFPLVLLVFVFAALQVDALGNFFRMYGKQFGPLQYDEFSHLVVQILVTPPIVWLLGKALEARGYHLSLGLTSYIAATSIFSLSAFYEIIELWDEVYFHGQRIWSTHDTAKDLQWDLVGIVLGIAVTSVVLRVAPALTFNGVGKPLLSRKGVPP
jgi:uncharacterized membrane protein YjdF